MRPHSRIGLVAGTTFFAAITLAGCGSSGSALHATTTINPAKVTTWSRSLSANTGPMHNVLMAATYAGHTAWAVGDFFNGSADSTLTERRSSGQWQVVTSPNASQKHNELDAVSGSSSSDVWAVGRYQPASGQEQTLVEHFNGTAWSVVASPNVGSNHNELDGVVSIDPYDAWAVGHYDTSTVPADKALIEHWDGTSWKIVPAPKFLAPISDLNAIAATPENGPLWAVGSQQLGLRTISLVCEYLDGVWRVVPSPNHGPYSNVLFGVESASLRDMWAVGSASHGASGTAVTMHWDGQDIDLEHVPRRLTHHYVLSAIATDHSRRVFAVGNYYSGHADVALILQWTGKHWVEVTAPQAGALHNALLGVTTSPGETPIAVGKYYGENADHTLILHCNC